MKIGLCIPIKLKLSNVLTLSESKVQNVKLDWPNLTIKTHFKIG